MEDEDRLTDHQHEYAIARRSIAMYCRSSATHTSDDSRGPTCSSGSKSCRSDLLLRLCGAPTLFLISYFAAAVDRGVIAQSPARGVQLPRIIRTEARFLTPCELEQLAAAMEPRYRAMVLVMAWATLRIGEATGLRRSDIDLDAGTVRIENNAVRVLGRPTEGPPTESWSTDHDVAVLGC